jgi:DNA-binding response OmpR family regulator
MPLLRQDVLSRTDHAATGTRESRNATPPRKAMRVLVVEDDALLAQGLTRVLTRAGHAVDHVETGLLADRALRAAIYDLVVLDIGLPDIDGFEVLRRLRQRHAATNVLVLTARDAVEDRVHGLDLGADDYLTKPFSVNEFEARVRALLRRTSLPAGAVSVGGLSVDVEAKRVRVGGTAIDLTVREWALLELFMSRPGRVLSKEHIAQQLADYDSQLTPNAIEVYVSRLRSKIEAAGVRIRTVRGFGYLWEAADE